MSGHGKHIGAAAGGDGKAVLRTHAAYDPYRVALHMREDMDAYAGAFFRAGAAAPSSIGLMPMRHPHASEQLSSDDYAVKADGGRDTGATTSNVKDDLDRKSLFIDRATHSAKQDFVGAIGRVPDEVRAAVRRVCAAGAGETLGKVAPEIDRVALSADMWPASENGKVFASTLFQLPGSIATLMPNTLKRLRAYPDLAAAGNLSSQDKSELHQLASDNELIGGASMHIIDRAHMLSRLILGCYDFYGVHHDEENPYLVTPTEAVNAGLVPKLRGDRLASLEALIEDIYGATPALLGDSASSQDFEGFPNPWHVPDALRKLDGGVFVEDAVVAPSVMPMYRHPVLSVDYGVLNWADGNPQSQPVYLAGSMTRGVGSLRGRPVVENGMHFFSGQLTSMFDATGDEPKSRFSTHESGPYARHRMADAHLCHASWLGAGDRGRLLSDPGSGIRLDFTPEGVVGFDAYLPVDQLLASCAISMHSMELGLLEAAKAINPLALAAVGHLVGLEEQEVKTYISTWSAANAIPSAWAGHALKSSEGTTGAEQHTAATRRFLRSIVRRHATNILARHPELLHPSVGAWMPFVPADFEKKTSGEPGRLKKRMTTLVPTLMAANIELPGGEDAQRFANSPAVLLGLGDRGARNMVPAPSVHGLPFNREGDLIPGCPFVVKEHSSLEEDPQSYLMPSDGRKSQVYCAFAWMGNQVRSGRENRLAPYDFLGSLFELNTHNNEFIRYQDEFKEYIQSVGSEKPAPAPTASPFQLVSQSLWEPKFTGINGIRNTMWTETDRTSDMAKLYNHSLANHFNGKSPEKLISTMFNGAGATAVNLFAKGVIGPHTHIAAQTLFSEHVQIKAIDQDLQPIKLGGPDKEIIKAQIQSAHCNKPDALNQGDVEVAASYLRFLRAVKSNVAGGVATGPGLKDLASLHLMQHGVKPSARKEQASGHAKIAAAVTFATGAVKTRIGAVRAAMAAQTLNAFAYDHRIDGVASFYESPLLAQTFNNLYDSALNNMGAIGALPDFAPMASLASVLNEDIRTSTDTKAPFDFFKIYGVDSPWSMPTEFKATLIGGVKELDPGATPTCVPLIKLALLPNLDDLSTGGRKNYLKTNPFQQAMLKTGFDIRSAFLDSGPSIPVNHWNNLTRHGMGPLFVNKVADSLQNPISDELINEYSPGGAIGRYGFVDGIGESCKYSYVPIYEGLMRAATFIELGVEKGVAHFVDDRALQGVPHLSASPLVEKGEGRSKGRGRAESVVALGAFATPGAGPVAEELAVLRIRADMEGRLEVDREESKMRERQRRRV